MPSVVLKTLLVSDLVESTRLTEELGDEAAAALGHRHDRLARDLLAVYQGREIDKTDGFLLLFERPWSAVLFALAYHRALRDLSREQDRAIEARVGIHVGEVVLRENPPQDVAQGAKPFEVEGLAKPLTARLMALAAGRQTLLSRAAFDVARRGAVGEDTPQGLNWLAHGRYLFKGVEEPLEVFEVGVAGSAPLKAPRDGTKARHWADEDAILGWRPASGLEPPGRLHWVLLRKLGEGGFGEVWLAAHEKTREQRVFKFCFDSSKLRSLQREITVFRLLNKELGQRRDITRVLDWNFDQAPYFIESEYTEGGNLSEWAVEQGGLNRVPLEVRLELVAQIAGALEAAHSVGVLHKDVKPQNVLIYRHEGRPMAQLTDFGIGAIIDRKRLLAADITALGTTSKFSTARVSTGGTPLYLAPEVLEGKAATRKSDIYALGVVLYQVVAGDFSHALAQGWRRDVDDQRLQDVIAVAIDGSPDERFDNAQRLAERLRALESRTDSGRTEAISTAAAASRHRRVRIGVAAAAVGLLALTGGYMAMRDRPAPPDTLAASAPAPALEQRQMIAVLPFENLGSPEDAYFAAGITEEITGRLAAVRGLGVISRNSARQYAGTEKTIEQIGEELGVTYVLEGSVRWARSGDGPGKVRITPQLVRVADDSNLWAEVYDRVLDDVFEVQTDVALSVLRELDVALLQPERDALEIRPTGNLDAYQAYLRGLDALEAEWSSATIRLAAQMFELAVELDPEFAHAHAWLAITHVDLVSGVAVSPEERRDRCWHSLAAAERALELAPDLPYAHMAMGNYHFRCPRDYQRALEQLAVAAAALPNDPEVMKWTAIMRRRQGHVEEAAERLARAVELDPRAAELAETLAYTFMMLRRYRQADVYLARSIALAPDQEKAYEFRAWNYLLWRGDTAAVREVLESMPARRGPWSVLVWTMVDFYTRDYSAMLDKLDTEPAESFPRSYPSSVLRCLVYSQMDPPERARRAWEALRLELELALAANPDHHALRIRLSWAYAHLGRRGEAIREVQRAIAALPITEDAILGSIFLRDAMWTYVFAGDHDTAIEHIDRLLSIPSGAHLSIALLRLDPLYDPLRQLPGFQELLAKHG